MQHDQQLVKVNYTRLLNVYWVCVCFVTSQFAFVTSQKWLFSGRCSFVLFLVNFVLVTFQQLNLPQRWRLAIRRKVNFWRFWSFDTIFVVSVATIIVRRFVLVLWFRVKCFVEKNTLVFLKQLNSLIFFCGQWMFNKLVK